MHLVISITILSFFLLILPFLAAIIKLTSPGPVFYSQERLGKDRRQASNQDPNRRERRQKNLTGRPFTIWKLRTMRSDAEATTGPVWASENDPRITRTGNFLRRSRLDEVPQLWNVLKGEMSLVGPRPERPIFAEKLRKLFPGYSSRLYQLKPGLTGLAQVNVQYDTTLEKVHDKLLLDHGYRLNSHRPKDHFIMDGKILLATIPTVLFGKGAR